jgi:hypothetical protein
VTGPLAAGTQQRVANVFAHLREFKLSSSSDQSSSICDQTAQPVRRTNCINDHPREVCCHMYNEFKTLSRLT